MTAPPISTRSAAILSILAFCTVLAAPVTAAERHCDARYTWETTGGSHKGTFARFQGRGLCGDSAPNRCRKRARAAIESCARVHWEKRWDRTVPEACVFRNTDSTVKNYDLTKRCARYGWQESPACWAFLDNGSETNVVTDVMATKGDLKASLEAEVCCVYKNGNHKFDNNRKVHVRAGWTITGDKFCPGGGNFSNDYVINCQAFRSAHCAHQNLWD